MSDENEVTPATEEQTEETTETASEEVTNTADQAETADTVDGIEDTEEKAPADSKHKKAFEDQKKRAEKAEGEAKTYKQKLIDAGLLDKDGKEKKPAPQNKEASPIDDNAVRARLEARGVLDEDAQDEVLEAARMLGITPLEALTRPLVKARLEEIKAEKASKNATPPPRNSVGRAPSTANVAVLADKVEKGGELPTDPALAEKVQVELARRAQNRH